MLECAGFGIEGHVVEGAEFVASLGEGLALGLALLMLSYRKTAVESADRSYPQRGGRLPVPAPRRGLARFGGEIGYR
jgi:hypothetical protein